MKVSFSRWISTALVCGGVMLSGTGCRSAGGGWSMPSMASWNWNKKADSSALASKPSTQLPSPSSSFSPSPSATANSTSPAFSAQQGGYGMASNGNAMNGMGASTANTYGTGAYPNTGYGSPTQPATYGAPTAGASGSGYYTGPYNTNGLANAAGNAASTATQNGYSAWQNSSAYQQGLQGYNKAADAVANAANSASNTANAATNAVNSAAQGFRTADQRNDIYGGSGSNSGNGAATGYNPQTYGKSSATWNDGAGNTTSSMPNRNFAPSSTAGQPYNAGQSSGNYNEMTPRSGSGYGVAPASADGIDASRNRNAGGTWQGGAADAGYGGASEASSYNDSAPAASGYRPGSTGRIRTLDSNWRSIDSSSAPQTGYGRDASGSTYDASPAAYVPPSNGANQAAQ